MKKAYPLLWVTPLVAIALLLTACHSSGAVKQLDETSARELIKARLSTEPFKIRLEGVNTMLGRTFKDYKAAANGTAQEQIVRRLLNGGFLAQSVDTLNYPRISGRFISQNTGLRTVYNLNMLPNSNLLSGDSYRTEAPESGVRPNNPWQVQGTVEPDGSLKLNTAGVFENAVYAEEGGSGFIDFRPPGVWGRYKGPASGKVEVKMYTYSWSQDFAQKQIRQGPHGDYIAAGELEAGEVSGLRLVTDTIATASFAWKASPSATGKAFYPDRTPTGSGEVSFGKKPDGTWFVDEIRVQ